jgi:rhodanese-related sulfurtransferase
MRYLKPLFLATFLLSNSFIFAQNDPFSNTKKETKTNEMSAENAGDTPDRADIASEEPSEKNKFSAEGVDTSAVQRLEIPTEAGKKISDAAYDKLLQSELSSSVPILTCQQVAEMLQKRSHRNQLAVLDGRTKAEFEVSHLQTAQRVGCADFSNELVWSINRNAIVVVYATSGRESEELGAKLKQMGFKNVYNLYGSIMEWVNQGYTVVDKNNEITSKVHVGAKKRAKFLKKGKAIF